MQDNKTTVANTIHDIKKTFRHEPHTLSAIRATLESDQKAGKNLIDLMEKHHDYLQESIIILTDKLTTQTEKQSHLDRFLHLFNMHGKAEEETLYEGLMRNDVKEARVEGLSGKTEHDHVFQISKELQSMNFNVKWTEEIEAKSKVIASLVGNHIKEEESVMFHIAKKDLSELEMKKLSDLYLTKCMTYINESLNAPRSADLGGTLH